MACLFSGRGASSLQLRAGGFRRSKLIAYRPALDLAGHISWASSYERGLVMFRKVTIALLATAALGMLAPDVVSARGGGGGGGGFHGGGGGFYGGLRGGGFHSGGGFGRDGFHAAGVSGGRFRGAAIGGRAFQAGFRDGFRAGLIAGASHSAKRMTGKDGQRTVQCLTSDCSSWHSYRD